MEPLTREQMEVRRYLAAHDLLSGMSRAKVARKYGVSRTSASRWARQLSEQGPESLRKKKALGRPSKMAAEDVEMLKTMYRLGPAAFGIQRSRWTTSSLSRAFARITGIEYDRDHFGKIMHRHGLLPSRPRRPKSELVLEAAGPAQSLLAQ